MVDGVFRLDQYLGEGESGAVFRTDFDGRKAVIKLIAADSPGSADRLARWQDAAKLEHPHLARILAFGRSVVAGTPVIYVVSDFADETLADVLAGRKLTPQEARDVLADALDALAYLHREGFAHGHLKASNFLAVDDQMKLSSDGVAPSLEAAQDVRMLGALFQSALEKPLPQPFLDITAHALDPNPRTRWTIAEIATRLDGRMPERAPQPKPAVWRYIVPAALVVIAAMVFLIAHTRRLVPPGQKSAPPVAQAAPPAASAAPAIKSEPEPAPPPQPAPESRRRSKPEHRAIAKSAPANAQGIVDQPMPEVPAAAIRTIHGKVTIPVRVDVDPSGNVTGAKLDGRAGSRYFAGFALKAARQWKFAPSSEPRSWILRFVFTRENTTVSPARVSP